ncbi:MAG: hypothetical protein AB1467_03635 [Candidatus Diapherotrites archaeon]
MKMKFNGAKKKLISSNINNRLFFECIVHSLMFLSMELFIKIFLLKIPL